MSEGNSWKMTTIEMALILATGLVTGLVVASLNSDRVEPTAQSTSQSAALAPPWATRPPR